MEQALRGVEHEVAIGEEGPVKEVDLGENDGLGTEGDLGLDDLDDEGTGDDMNPDEVDTEVEKKMAKQMVTPGDGPQKVVLNETAAAELAEVITEADVAAKESK